jgi:hypothetical protein
MADARTQRLFLMLDKAFWLIWLGFPILIWLIVTEVLDAPSRLVDLAPDQVACIDALPMVVNFSAIGQAAFWVSLAFELAANALLLGLAHRVIHRCATGRVFVAEMIGTLRLIGWIIALWPMADLILSNATLAVFTAMGDIAAYQPNFALDLPVLGVGLLLITMAAAMRMAVRLHDDAALTI